MPNIGSVLRQEISRLARREISGPVRVTRKASAQYRHDIAALKREVAALQRKVAALPRRAPNGPVVATHGADEGKLRFVAKGLRAQRKRLALSAADFGKLVGVSAQSVYNWEQGHAKPRAAQLAAIAMLRTTGKREARSFLEQMAAKKTTRRT
jgi:DNA-binding XRE family transcriptional regulator